MKAIAIVLLSILLAFYVGRFLLHLAAMVYYKEFWEGDHRTIPPLDELYSCMWRDLQKLIRRTRHAKRNDRKNDCSDGSDIGNK